jgi:hypothetical protein
MLSINFPLLLPVLLESRLLALDWMYSLMFHVLTYRCFLRENLYLDHHESGK